MSKPNLYAIRAGDSDHLKIGQSTAPDRRIASLQTGSPYRLQLIATAKPGISEKVLHKVFTKEGICRWGEWFEIPAYLDPLVREIFAAIDLFAEAITVEEQRLVVQIVNEAFAARALVREEVRSAA